MGIDLKEVGRVAGLIRLELSAEQKKNYCEQLNTILEYVDTLKEVDTADIMPTTHGLSQHNVMREDEVKPSLPLEKVFLNAPEHEDGQFVVPAVLE